MPEPISSSLGTQQVLSPAPHTSHVPQVTNEPAQYVTMTGAAAVGSTSSFAVQEPTVLVHNYAAQERASRPGSAPRPGSSVVRQRRWQGTRTGSDRANRPRSRPFSAASTKRDESLRRERAKQDAVRFGQLGSEHNNDLTTTFAGEWTTANLHQHK